MQEPRPSSAPSTAARQLRAVELAGRADAELLERFVRERDEAAFEVLLARHGPLVLGVCRRILRQQQDAEDAFQATFLVLARKGAAIGRGHSLAGWLFAVARRISWKARRKAERQPTPTGELPEVPQPEGVPAVVWRELREALDHEVSRLPAAYREAFLICDLEERTHDDAARELGCPRGTVSSRVSHARRLLRERLTARGVTLSGAVPAGGLLPGGVADAVPASLARSTAAMLAGPDAPAVRAAVAALAWVYWRGVLMRKVLLVTTVGLLGLTLTGGAVWALQRPAPPAPSTPQGVTAAPRDTRPLVLPRSAPVKIHGRAPSGLLPDEAGQPTTTTRVARTQAEMEKLAPKEQWEGLAKQFGVPKLDFQKYMVIQVMHGPFTHGGCRVEVRRVVQEGDAWTVYWKLHEPGPDQPVPGILSHPGEFILVDQFTGTIRFVREK